MVAALGDCLLNSGKDDGIMLDADAGLSWDVA
jgi:hypothetical protein